MTTQLSRIYGQRARLDHLEDRRLARPLVRQVDLLGRNPDASRDVFGETDEEVREDHPTVPARSHHCRLRRHRGDLADLAVGVRAEPVCHGAHGEREIRPRVPVRDRIDVDAIQFAPLALSVVAGGDQGTPKSGAVDVADLHGVGRSR